MKATINYISKSNKSASISLKQTVGPITQTISGFVGLPEDHKMEVGMELDIPAKSVRTEVRRGEDGTPFNFLIFEV
jgi:hypothetical protein